MLVSVVIPIYNVEKYLNRCIKSVVNQTYQNLEIILVDDGSPDACPKMCDDWAKKDNRIKVIHKQNEGLGYARNSGIDCATGDAICFIDSDDYVLQNMIQDCVAEMEKERTELVCYGFRRIACDGVLCGQTIPSTQKIVYRGDAVRSSLLAGWAALNRKTKKDCNIVMSACAALFSKQLIDKVKWRFVSEREIISEDFYSLLVLYAHIQAVSVLPMAYYCYCENKSSLTKTFRPDRYAKIVVFYHETAKLCETLGYQNVILDAVVKAYFSFVMGAFKLIETSNNITNQDKLCFIKEICNDITMQHLLKNYHDKTISFFQIIFWKLVKYRWYAAVKLCLKIKTQK